MNILISLGLIGNITIYEVVSAISLRGVKKIVQSIGGWYHSFMTGSHKHVSQKVGWENKAYLLPHRFCFFEEESWINYS